MWPDRVSNPRPLVLQSDALLTALRDPAVNWCLLALVSAHYCTMSQALVLIINIQRRKKHSLITMRDRAWFVRLYGEIIPELERGDYRPYRRTNHALYHLYHGI